MGKLRLGPFRYCTCEKSELSERSPDEQGGWGTADGRTISAMLLPNVSDKTFWRWWNGTVAVLVVGSFLSWVW